MNQKGQGLLEYAIILCLVAIVVIAVLNAVDNGDRRAFDEKYDSGEITLVGQPLLFGEVGHPKDVGVMDVPLGGLTDHPRKISVTGCKDVQVGKVEAVYAASPSIGDRITIQMPLQAGGYMNICVPEGLSFVPVYIWAK